MKYLVLLFVATSFAQSVVPPRPLESRNLTYLTASGRDLQLDVYQNTAATPAPVLVYFHGGAWWKGERPKSYASFRAYLAMGFSVVTVDYRLSDVALAPAAVQDARCAMAWVKANAAKYNFDPGRIVTFGTSAGGHLALMAGMLPKSANIDLPQCSDVPKAAAILDFYGPTELRQFFSAGGAGNSVVRWIGTGSSATAMAKLMSPMANVSPGLPPVFLAHGDADPTVPNQHSVSLQKALTAAGIPNRMYSVPGGVHGNFGTAQNAAIAAAIQEFLIQQKVLRPAQ